MYQDIFKSFGLHPKETLVYEALLKLGETGIKPLLRETGLKRGNLYDTLYALEKKELCELVRKDKKTRFRPASPNNLKALAELEREQVEKNTRELGSILPKLNELFSAQSAKPFVAYYESVEGLKKIHKLILEKNKPLKILASYVDQKNLNLRELIEKQAHRQRLRGIRHQAIVPAAFYKTTPEKQELFQKQGIEIKKLEGFLIPSQIVMFDTSVAISSLAPDIFTTYIENASIAKTLEIIFDQLWLQAKPT